MEAIILEDGFVIKNNQILLLDSITGEIRYYDLTQAIRSELGIVEQPGNIAMEDCNQLPVSININDEGKALFKQCLLDLMDDPEEDIDIFHLMELKNRQDNVIIQFMALQTNNIVKIEKFMEHVVASYSAQQFQENFRLTRESFQYILGEIRLVAAPAIVGPGRPQICLEKQLLAVIWLLATPESYRSVSERFGMTKGSLSDSFVRVVNAINILFGRFISWPTGSRRQHIKRKFQEQNSAFKGCIGLIDGTYVKVKAPKDQVRSYTNRKCFTSMTLQAICDMDKKFIDVYTGWPSSFPDIRIFKNSHIYTYCERDLSQYFDEGEFILGDKGYQGGADWCVVPFNARETRTTDHIRFNECHSKIRTRIENSFALLFGRFRRLKDLDMNREDWIPATIMASCVLHNICLDRYDPNMEEYCQEGTQYLQCLNEMPENNCNGESDGSTRNSRANTREQIFRDYQRLNITRN